MAHDDREDHPLKNNVRRFLIIFHQLLLENMTSNTTCGKNGASSKVYHEYFREKTQWTKNDVGARHHDAPCDSREKNDHHAVESRSHESH